MSWLTKFAPTHLFLFSYLMCKEKSLIQGTNGKGYRVSGIPISMGVGAMNVLSRPFIFKQFGVNVTIAKRESV